jgi:tRNA-specific 2-thiouridylase
MAELPTLAPEHTLRSQGDNTRIIEESGEFFLSRAQDNKKTQEYFLSHILRDHLDRILFPLGEMTKDEVRSIAKDNDLPCIHRESQDVCFIPDGDTHSFLCKHLGQKPGDIVDLSGKVLGQHRGIWNHTIGQRKGLGIAAAGPLFVISLDIENNRIIVGPRSALAGDSFRLTQINRFTDRDLSLLPLTCKIRYATPEVSCRLDGDEVILAHPVDAITPGQLGVIYWQDKVVMAGFIATQPV